jgi:hypothetical protein
MLKRRAGTWLSINDPHRRECAAVLATPSCMWCTLCLAVPEAAPAAAAAACQPYCTQALGGSWH